VLAIRRLATGALRRQNIGTFLRRELRIAILLSVVLGLCAFLRVCLLSTTPLGDALAIALSLSCIVLSSVCIGAMLPLLFSMANIDPANSSTSIQVLMDITGVLITCLVATVMLDGKET
jgi:Mg/Co/Ni transporter MgtE